MRALIGRNKGTGRFVRALTQKPKQIQPQITRIQYVTIITALKFCHEKNLFKIGEIGGICGFNFGI